MHLENQFYPMTTEIEKTNEDASHTGDKGQEHSNSNVQIDERINEVYDALWQHKIICSHKFYGYADDLKGADFKILEYPVVNTSYSLMDPGWLNDKIIDAYTSLLVKAASKKGICVQALNCFFYTCLKNEYQSCFARLVHFDNAILRCRENGDVAIVGVICNCRGNIFKILSEFFKF